MKKLQATATYLGVSIGTVYAFFSLPYIQELFVPSFILLLKQILVIGFGICLFISPSSIIEMGAKLAAKLPNVYNAFFGKNKSQS